MAPFGSVSGLFRVRFGSVSGVLGGVVVGSVRGASVREKNITTLAVLAKDVFGAKTAEIMENKKPIKTCHIKEFGGRNAPGASH